MSRLNKQLPADFTPDDEVSEQIRQRFHTGKMPCGSALEAAVEWNMPTMTLGHYADYLRFPLTRCQIGLFGYGKGTKLVKVLESVDPVLADAVRSKTTDNIIRCEDVFAIAEEKNVDKVDVGSVCQTLGIKIKHCRLGAF